MARPPEQPLARLYRYVDYLPVDVLCKFETEKNLLLINRDLWENLTDSERADIMRDARTIIVKHSYAIDDAA
jgi:hypothetical protein